MLKSDFNATVNYLETIEEKQGLSNYEARILEGLILGFDGDENPESRFYQSYRPKIVDLVSKLMKYPEKDYSTAYAIIEAHRREEYALNRYGDYCDNCYCYLFYGQCQCTEKHSAYSRFMSCGSSLMDHVSFHKKGFGAYTLIAQPYIIPGGELRKLEAVCDINNLVFEINPQISWWNPGKTTAVIISNESK